MKKATVRILRSGAVRERAGAGEGDYVFEARKHVIYVQTPVKLQDAQSMASAFLSRNRLDSEVRFRGVV